MRPDGLYLHLPEERKEFLFEADPKTFVKYMWGKTPNVIVQIDRVSRHELESLVREAWQHAAPAEQGRSGTRRRASFEKKKGGARRPSN